MRSIRAFPILVLVLLLAVPVGGTTASRPAIAVEAINAMLHTARGNLTAHVSPATGSYDFIDAAGTDVIARDDASAEPEARAGGFLRLYGSALGLRTAELRALDTVLRVRDVYTDPAGNTHVRYAQIYRGHEVFGGSLVVHMNRHGITGVSGTYVPDVTVAARPSVSRAHAGHAALNAVAKTYGTTDLSVVATTLTVFRSGLIEDRRGSNRLAFQIDVAGAGIKDRVMVDAAKGIVLRQIPMIHAARDRIAYSPQYDPHNPDLFALRREDSPPSMIPPVDKLFDFTGQVYDLYKNTFGRDSFDAKGKTMRTVYLINDACPNAYWNSSTTNYCPHFDHDDVVAHEWTHAFTEYTHGLVYSCEPGALNESYSDIYGEIIDLINGMDGIGGSNNDQPYPDGQRWIVGEDLGQPVQELILRDMWDPERLFAPGKVTGEDFVCDNQSDGGGVHTNSGIPNHAFAMLVDGKTYNGTTIKGIGLTKAAHIYYQAMAAYQTATSGFEIHALSLQASCADLAGVNLKALMTGAPSGQRITAGDCAQVTNAAVATEMFKTPVQCAYQPLLNPALQPICPAAQVFLNETWESGSDGWTFGHEGTTEDFPNVDWAVRSGLPKRKGHAAFALDPVGGVCRETAGDYAGRFWMDSPEVRIADGAENLTLRFDHYVATEVADGGNVSASVNGGEFTLLDSYTFNPPTGALPDATPFISGNTNPKAGEIAWFTADPGEVTGSWGTTTADLSEVASPGDSIRLRFDFGIDSCGGIEGWYVDDIAIYACPELPLPELALRDAGNPDPDREVTLQWTRPAGAVGPDEVQRSAGETLFIDDDAESGTDGWTITTNGVGVLGWQTTQLKSNSGAASFVARAVDPPVAGESSLEWAAPIAVPKQGETILTWHQWYAGEGDDAAYVEIHNGKEWVTVKKKSAGRAAEEAAMGFLNEAFAKESLNLSGFGGKSVRLRFRFTVGAENRIPSTAIFGWHVDDINLISADWRTVTRPAKALARLSGLADGKHAFRVRTSYKTGFGFLTPGPWSKTVVATVKGKATAVRGTKTGRTLPATGVGTPTLAFALIAGAALTLRALRRGSPLR